MELRLDTKMLLTNSIYINFQGIVVPRRSIQCSREYKKKKNSLRVSPYISTVDSWNENNKPLVTTIFFLQDTKQKPIVDFLSVKYTINFLWQVV